VGGLKTSKPVKPKAKCCKDKPRCKRCPVVLKRLADEGYATRLSKREYIVVDISKKVLAQARTR
jgi:hypothetical protein